MSDDSLFVKLIDKIFSWLYWPICRFYARHYVGDNPADSVYRFLCSFQFLRTHHFWPNFFNPQRFSEKIWSRMFNERDSKLTLISDKLRVRNYVANRVGGNNLINLLWTGDDPADIPFDELPVKFVIKTNHGCGSNIIVTNKTQLDKERTIKKLRKWLSTNFCEDKYLGTEWGYKNIKPTLIIEEFLEENGKTPVDYKFYCFSGRVEFLSLHFSRFEGHKTRSFGRNFEPYDLRYNLEQWGGECQRPRNFEGMVQLAESLAKGLAFIRVDLYSVKDDIYFGELTLYPGGVRARFLPPERDFILGKKWKTD